MTKSYNLFKKIKYYICRSARPIGNIWWLVTTDAHLERAGRTWILLMAGSWPLRIGKKGRKKCKGAT